MYKIFGLNVGIYVVDELLWLCLHLLSLLWFVTRAPNLMWKHLVFKSLCVRIMNE